MDEMVPSRPMPHLRSVVAFACAIFWVGYSGHVELSASGAEPKRLPRVVLFDQPWTGPIQPPTLAVPTVDSAKNASAQATLPKPQEPEPQKQETVAPIPMAPKIIYPDRLPDAPTVTKPVALPVVPPAIPPDVTPQRQERVARSARSSSNSQAAIRRPEIAPLPSKVRMHDDVAMEKRLALVGRQSAHHVRYGFALAARGATHSARAEFVEVLNRVAQAIDLGTGDQRHGHALAAGLGALEEAKDFHTGNGRLATELSLTSLVATHQTPVLKREETDLVSPLVAEQRYLNFALQQLAFAANRQPAASAALYGLARLESMEAERAGVSSRSYGPRAMVFHQAALLIDPRNHVAANELGVLFARYGQLELASVAFRQSVSVSAQPETWHNLATVYTRQGAHQKATEARRESARLLAAKASAADATAPSHGVSWVSPDVFNRDNDRVVGSLNGQASNPTRTK